MMPALSKRGGLRICLLLCAALWVSPVCATAQSSTPQILDVSALKPPAGARVAIVEFDDLECPACAHANPILKAAAAKYDIPWIRHDFLIPSHNWSRNAAINARWFDSKSKTLGDDYRDYVFANQRWIYNVNVLNQFTEKFAQAHGITLPMALDPQGKLAGVVKADSDLAMRMGLKTTPSIFILAANSKGAPYIQVHDADKDLYQTIDRALADTHNASPAKKK